jgi:hypothetical protein
MTDYVVQLDNGYYPFFNKGKPIFNGFIYIGEPDLDPETPANQIDVYYIQEDNTRVLASQPIRTSSGGVPTFNGSPVRIIVEQFNYSLKVKDSQDNQIYYNEDVAGAEALVAGIGKQVVETANDPSNPDPQQDLKRKSNPAVGWVVETKNYSDGNGGGGTYEGVLTSTVTPNDFNIIMSDADNTISFVLRQDTIFNLSANGATNDNIDSSAAIANTLSIMPEGATLTGEDGFVYRIDSPQTVTDKSINIKGNFEFDFSNNSTTLDRAISIQGSASATTTTATADINKGAASITVASESGFAAGDWIEILSDTELLGSTATYTKGEIRRVSSTAANTLNIDGGTSDSYDTSTPTVTITKLNMINKPVVEGITIRGSGVSADRHIGLFIQYAYEPRVERVSVFDCAAEGMDFNRCTYGLMYECHTENNNDLTGPTGYGYVFSNLTMFSTVENCTARLFRHAFNVAGLYRFGIT